MEDIAINLILRNCSWFDMDISVVDRETLAEDFFDLFSDGMTLVNREVGVHFYNNVKVDVTPIGTATLLFNFGNFRDLQNSFFIGLEISLVETV